jgi:hypothetical protein
MTQLVHFQSDCRTTPRQPKKKKKEPSRTSADKKCHLLPHCNQHCIVVRDRILQVVHCFEKFPRIPVSLVRRRRWFGFPPPSVLTLAYRITRRPLSILDRAREPLWLEIETKTQSWLAPSVGC